MFTAPPPVLDMARVIAYAMVTPEVEWTGKQKLFVDGELLGAVPQLAICQNLSGPLTDFLLFHCDEDWRVLGVSGAPSLEEVKAIAERGYKGISSLWVDSGVSKEAAEKYIRSECADDVCSFCGRLPTEAAGMVRGKSATICFQCIASFQSEIQEG